LTRAAVFQATLAELGLRGYAELSLDAVAARSRVHKTTIYRRWRSRERLVAEAFMDLGERALEVPDSGDFERDARGLARSVAVTLSQPLGAAAVRAIASAAQTDERRAIARRFWLSRLVAVRPMVERAVQRGQLPHDTDAAQVITAIAAPLYFRLLVTDEPLTPEAADLAAAAALAAARAGLFASA
jgi:AcrR family transcriptional regulator